MKDALEDAVLTRAKKRSLGGDATFGRCDKPFQRVDPSVMARIAEIAGRAVSSAYNARANNAVAQGGITEIETGRDVARWLPSELALLSDDETEDLALARYADSSAMQFQQEGDGEIGNGPIVVMLDLSGSMRVEDLKLDGRTTERLAWAAGVAQALAEIASWQRRECRLIGYGGSVLFDEVLTSERQTTELLSRLYHEGTCLDVAMLHLAHSGYANGADIVLISDGEDSGWEIAAEKAKAVGGARLHAVAIGSDWKHKAQIDTFTLVNGASVDISGVYAAL
jgi:uncharacterized protein with von Willebrand factor type A (vWA) domain